MAQGVWQRQGNEAFGRLRALLADMAQTVDALDTVAEHLDRSTQRQQRMVEGMRRRASQPAVAQPERPPGQQTGA